MRYRITDETVLEITDEVYNKFVDYCQNDKQPESGGVLIGKVKEDYSLIVISEISIPAGNEDCGRFYFVRNKYRSQKVIEQFWKDSQGELNYIGEWHTHPEESPSPSFVDKKLLKNCIKYNKYSFPWLFMIIVGKQGDLFVGFQTKNMQKMRKIEEEKR